MLYLRLYSSSSTFSAEFKFGLLLIELVDWTSPLANLDDPFDSSTVEWALADGPFSEA